jgi:hypothetical protein
MSETAKICATHREFTYKDKTYDLSLIDQEAKSKFAIRQYRKAQQRVKDFVNAEHGNLGERELDVIMQAELALVKDMYLMGRFAILSKDGIQNLLAPDGIMMLLSILANIKEDLAQEMALACPKEAGNVIKEIIGDSFPGLEGPKKKEADQGPK